jgi:hypothetical protein
MSRSPFVDSSFSVGRRPSGAKLYHQGSVFGPPAQRRIDRELIARLLFLIETLDRNTRTPGLHGGDLKAKGRDVLRALLIVFYNRRNGECFPSYEAIAKAAGCARSTVALALKRLVSVGLVEIVRRKTVARFELPGKRSFDCAVQDSNSYLFNFAYVHRWRWGDLSLPLFRGKQPKSDNRTETGPINPMNAQKLSPELEKALLRYGEAIKKSE